MTLWSVLERIVPTLEPGNAGVGRLADWNIRIAAPGHQRRRGGALAGWSLDRTPEAKG